MKQSKFVSMKPATVILLILLFGCKEKKDSVVKKKVIPNVKMALTEATKNHSDSSKVYDSIAHFLDNPVDFYKLKKATRHMHSGGNMRLSNRYFHSFDDDSYIYYDYWAIEFDRTNKRSLSFKVLKPWKKKSRDRYYSTDNEILVGIKSKIAWKGLNPSNFVGKSKAQLLNQLGEANFAKNQCLVYHRNDKFLVLKMKQNKVAWFKYFWLKKDVELMQELPDEIYYWSTK